MRLRMLRPLSSLVLCLFPAWAVAAEQCSADCTHATKACVCAIDARRVAVTPLGAVDRQPVQLRQALETGDEIVSGDENALVGLTCPGGSDVKLHGVFRAVIMPAAAGQDCALNLLAGNADVLTNNPTQVASGETVMGSERTMYSMRVGRDASVECRVFEGQVQVRNPKLGTSQALGTSSKAFWRGGRISSNIAPLSREDIDTTSKLYSLGDVARARAQGVSFEDLDSFKQALQARYSAVLARPDDPAPRIALAALQANARVSTQALYHLAKAEQLNPSRTDQRATIAATKWQAYKQIGREPEAAAESEKLRTLDPQRYQLIQQIDPKRIQRLNRGAYEPSAATRAGRGAAITRPESAARALLVIAATAAPPVVRVGEATAISVTARTSDGAPIAGAKVVVAAGGGLFRQTGQTRAEGVTDSNGGFRTEWLCKQCAPAYRLEVEVTAAQYPPGKTTVDVKTR